MVDRLIVRRGAYHDSVSLMLASREASLVEGVNDIAAVTATPLNVELLRDQGYDLDAEGQLGPTDLVIALRAVNEASAQEGLAAVERSLKSRRGDGQGAQENPPRSLASAKRRRPEHNLAFVSVPGRYAAFEVASALEAGMHVHCFSDGLSIEQELILKRRADELDLLLMGPDCGTAILNGVGLGFSNAVQRGPVGIVAASGTGIQEIVCSLDTVGVGISQAIGVGGRDLSSAVGGTMLSRGLELLAGDDETELVIIISKPPDPAVAESIMRQAERVEKPVIVAFLGTDGSEAGRDGVEVTGSLEKAAHLGAAHFNASIDGAESAAVGSTPGFIRGLFVGGTLCDEAMQVVSRVVGPVLSNIPLRPEWRLEDSMQSDGHTFVDYGEDEFTQGRAHPMIDPTLRAERFRREAQDTSVGVVVLDMVLGYGSHPDPAGELAPIIEEALETRGETLTVVVSVCAAAHDPQLPDQQIEKLTDAGAVVTRQSAAAARLALKAAVHAQDASIEAEAIR